MYFLCLWLPFLKVEEVCSFRGAAGSIGNPVNDQSCSFRNAKIKYLNSGGSISLSRDPAFSGQGVLLEDGSFIVFNYGTYFTNNDSLYFIFDTNGLNKAPNTYGRDIFVVGLTSDGLRFSDYDDSFEDCTMEHESYGTGCVSRLIKEGKMDY